jgi:alpha-tubulin suppressor-like RCC1 family protein
MGVYDNYPDYAVMEINQLKLKNIIDISSGHLHTLAINDLGDIYGWGCCFSGQLGFNNENSIFKPLKIFTIKI